MADRTDDALMVRARNGDEEAFRALFERHENAMARRIGRLLPDGLRRKVSIADVVQETRIDAFRGRKDFDPGKGDPRDWLMGIARNKALMTLRRHAGTAKRRWQQEVTRGRRRDTAQFAHPGPSPSTEAIRAETAERVRAAMDSLPEDYRQVLRLARLEGLSLRQVAERMDRSREAVKKLYGRALCRCRQVFLEMEERPDGP